MHKDDCHELHDARWCNIYEQQQEEDDRASTLAMPPDRPIEPMTPRKGSRALPPARKVESCFPGRNKRKRNPPKKK
jgi:hypothetical protein